MSAEEVRVAADGSPPDPAVGAERDWFERVGYFTEVGQREPVYDPPHDAACFVCGKPITPTDVRTVNVMPANEPVVSAFFRVHRSCAEASPDAVTEVEHRIIESFTVWDSLGESAGESKP